MAHSAAHCPRDSVEKSANVIQTRRRKVAVLLHEYKKYAVRPVRERERVNVEAPRKWHQHREQEFPLAAPESEHVDDLFQSPELEPIRYKS